MIKPLFFFLITGCSIGYFTGCSARSSDNGPLAPPASDAQIAAAKATATDNALCTKLGSFYWEIGNSTAVIASGTIGSGATRDTVLSIASATKWIFAAYVFQKYSPVPASYLSYLQLTSGYVNLPDVGGCTATQTPADCIDSNSIGFNSNYKNKFYYNGAHFLKLAATLFPNYSISEMNTEVLTDTLSLKGNLAFQSPSVGGSLTGSAADVATFLQGLLTGIYNLGPLLGQTPVCTLPASCSTAASSSVPENWKYSWGHWVEDSAGFGGIAYSSAGKFGFYPWIDGTKQYYGIISRQDTTSQNAFWDSIQCGRTIRAAFLRGHIQ